MQIKTSIPADDLIANRLAIDILDAISNAELLGYVVEVVRDPQPPLMMGNHIPHVHIRKAREAACKAV